MACCSRSAFSIFLSCFPSRFGFFESDFAELASAFRFLLDEEGAGSGLAGFFAAALFFGFSTLFRFFNAFNGISSSEESFIFALYYSQ